MTEAQSMFTDDQLRYHAEKGGFPANALAEELLRVREKLALAKGVHSNMSVAKNDAIRECIALRARYERVRALVGEWRAAAAKNDRSHDPEHQTVAMILEDCADDLEQTMKEGE